MAWDRTLEVTVISARDLKDVNLFTPLKIYALVGLSSDPAARQRGSTDPDGRRNPVWNDTFLLRIPAAADPSDVTLDILLRAEGSVTDTVVGEVNVTLADLGSENVAAGGRQFVSYKVRRPSGSAKGELKFSYRFVDPPPVVAEPTTYPVYPPPQTYPQPPLYPQAYPQPAPYPQPELYPQPYGYGYHYHQPPGVVACGACGCACTQRAAYGHGYAYAGAQAQQPWGYSHGGGTGSGWGCYERPWGGY